MTSHDHTTMLATHSHHVTEQIPYSACPPSSSASASSGSSEFLPTLPQPSKGSTSPSPTLLTPFEVPCKLPVLHVESQPKCQENISSVADYKSSSRFSSTCAHANRNEIMTATQELAPSDFAENSTFSPHSNISPDKTYLYSPLHSESKNAAMTLFPHSPSSSSTIPIPSLSDRNPLSSFFSPPTNDGSGHQPIHTLVIPEILHSPFIFDDCVLSKATSSVDPFPTKLSIDETAEATRIADINEPGDIVIERCEKKKNIDGSSLNQGNGRKPIKDSPSCADALINRKTMKADDINFNKVGCKTKISDKVNQAVKNNEFKSLRGQVERKTNLEKGGDEEEGVYNSPTRYRKQKGCSISTPSFSSFLSTSTPISSKSNSAATLYSPLPHGPKYGERRSYRPSAPISSGIQQEPTSLSLPPKTLCNSFMKDKKPESRIVCRKGVFLSSKRSPSYSRSRSRSRSKSKSKSRSRSRSRSISLSPFHSFSLSSSSSLTTSSTSTTPSSPRSSRSPIFRSRTSESRTDTHRDASSREYQPTAPTSSSSKSHQSLRKDERRHHRNHRQHSSHRSRHASETYDHYHRYYPKYHSTPSVSRDYRGGQYRYNRLRQYSSYRPGSLSPSSSSRHRSFSNSNGILTSSMSLNPIGFDVSSSSPSMSFSATSNVEVLTDYTSKAASFRSANFIHTTRSNASKKRYSSPSEKVGTFPNKRLRTSSMSWSRSRSSSKSRSKSRSFSRSVSPRPRSLSRSRSRSHSSRSQTSSPTPRIPELSKTGSLGAPLSTTDSAMATFCPARSSNLAIQNSASSGKTLDDSSLSFSSLNSSSSVEAAYEALVQVGEGTYGKVFKARDVERKLVALKRIRIEKEKEGFPITALREIKLLQSLSHPNVIHLLDLAVDREAVYMVFEYMHHDLAGLLQHPTLRFQPFHIRYFMNQLFQGLSFLHSKGIVHRDLKGSNLLLNQRGELKLADFGLARHISRNSVILTNRVITLWYRPIELLLGSTHYSTSIDVWSAGCILLEFFLHKPAFPGVDELHQVDTVVGICGTLSPDIWPGCVQLPWYHLFSSPPKPRVLREVYHDLVPALALDLVDQLLQLNPDSRPTAQQVLEHPYFLEEDMQPPIQLLASLKHEDWHEFESKRRNKKAHTSSPLPRPLSHGSLVSMLLHAKKNGKSMVLSSSSLIHQTGQLPIPSHHIPVSKSALVEGFVELVS